MRVDSDRERMAVPAIRRSDAIALLEDARDASRDRLLPGIQMRRSVDLAREKQRLDEILEPANEEHLAVDARVQLEIVENTRRRLIADVAHCTRSGAGEADASAIWVASGEHTAVAPTPTPASEARRSVR